MKISNKVKVSVVVFTAMFVFGLVGIINAATAVTLGTADDFAVLADTAISDAAPTGAITGDVGLGPTSGGASITGLTSGQVSGTIYAMDAAGPDGATGNNPTLVGSAKTALTAAYLNAQAQTLPSVTAVTESSTDSFGVGTLNNGAILAPGVYKSDSTMGITGTLTLNGGADDVWIFQAGSSLTSASGADIVLTGGAQACNVFWQVTSSAVLGTGTLFKGNILALTSITDAGDSIIQGRLLARNGAVSLHNTTVVKATCVVPPSAPTPVATSGSASYWAPLPLINITKIPNPLALPSGQGSVTYTYNVTNEGKVAMGGVWVKDNKCADVKFISGDNNSDSKLDLDESWIYRCVKTVSKTETNTATAHGSANGWDGYDTANATVVVGVPLTPPLIHLVKKPNVFVLPAGGGAVTYTYTVTNPGTVPLNNVSIVDDKCTGLPGRVVGHPGDLNKNNLLESNESWSFTCQTNITQTTTNIGTAQGHANGLTAIDFSPATVVVTAPGLPNTGLFDGKNALWLVLAGIVIAVLVLFYAIRKKQTV
jgi:hypothetical protein